MFSAACALFVSLFVCSAVFSVLILVSAGEEE